MKKTGNKIVIDTRFYCLPPESKQNYDYSGVYNYSLLLKEELKKLELKGFYPIITAKLFAGQMNYSPLEDMMDYYGNRVYSIAYEITADKLVDSNKYQTTSPIRIPYNKHNLSSQELVRNRTFQIQLISDNQEKLIDYENKLAFNKSLENALKISKEFNKEKNSILCVLHPTNTNWKIMKELLDDSNKNILSETNNGLLRILNPFGIKELSSLVALNTANALSKSEYEIVPVFSSASKRNDFGAGIVYRTEDKMNKKFNSDLILYLLSEETPCKQKRRISWKNIFLK